MKEEGVQPGGAASSNQQGLANPTVLPPPKDGIKEEVGKAAGGSTRQTKPGGEHQLRSNSDKQQKGNAEKGLPKEEKDFGGANPKTTGLVKESKNVERDKKPRKPRISRPAGELNPDKQYRGQQRAFTTDTTVDETQASPAQPQPTREDQIGMLRPGTWNLMDGLGRYLDDKKQFMARALEYVYPQQCLPGSPLESDEFHPYMHPGGLVVEQDKKRLHYIRTTKQSKTPEMEEAEKPLIGKLE